MLRKIWKAFLSAVYPNRCPYCQSVVSSDKTCCDNCNRSVERHLERVAILEDTERDIKSYCFTPLKYKGLVKQAIWRYKFRGCKSYSEHFADEIIKGMGDIYYNFDFDVVTFVPMSRTRKLERGYNQSEVLAREIGKKLNIDCSCLLTKIRDNKPQHNLDSLERIENVKGVYCVDNPSTVQGKKILVCDDVFTTGSTLRECCKELYKAGADSVECVAIAHTALK